VTVTLEGVASGRHDVRSLTGHDRSPDDTALKSWPVTCAVMTGQVRSLQIRACGHWPVTLRSPVRAWPVT